jgi:hypothetical protein
VNDDMQELLCQLATSGVADSRKLADTETSGWPASVKGNANESGSEDEDR